MTGKPFDSKTPEMKAAIEGVFPGTLQAIAEHKCPLCKGAITEFRDEVSKREYKISGMCQKCQDEIWGVKE